MAKPFLTAQWRHLAMLNYEVENGSLDDLAPAGTEIDQWEGRTFVSVVGFLFLDTRVLGLPIPFHRNFPEVNLRYYVRRKTRDGWRRAVIFVKEIAPRFAIAAIANTLFNENYVALPMDFQIDKAEGNPERIQGVTYGWKHAGRRQHLSLNVDTEPTPLIAGGIEEFITEHYWGFTVARNGGLFEYEVRHPQWRVAVASHTELDCDAERLYGKRFAKVLGGKPASAFLADGSEVAIFNGVRAV